MVYQANVGIYVPHIPEADLISTRLITDGRSQRQAILKPTLALHLSFFFVKFPMNIILVDEDCVISKCDGPDGLS